MRPQLQLYRDGNPDVYGDCHRTCIAMILNMDRDDVPHFMHDLPPNLPGDDPRSLECLQREIDWLRSHGLAPVSIPFDGSQDIAALLESWKAMTHGAPVVMGCQSPNGNHSVVVWEGEIYNPTNGTIVGPMLDGYWWMTAYAATGNWQTRDSTRRLAFTAGYSASMNLAFGGDNPARQGSLEDALQKYLQQQAPAPTVNAQETN